MWVAEPQPWALAVAAVAVALGAAGARGRGLAWLGGVVLLLAAVLTAFGAQHSVASLLSDWESYWAERQAEVGEVLAISLERRQAAAEAAADGLAEKAVDPTDQVDLDFVRELRTRHDVSALALYDADGRLNLWDGAHWGKVPESVQGGFLRHTYYDRPLFGYLYVTALTEDGRVVMAADLLRADLPAVIEAGVEDFASRFRTEVGEEVRVTQFDPGIQEGVWDLALPDRRLMSVVVDRPTAGVRAAEILGRWRALVAALILLGWGLLALGCPLRRRVAVGGALSLLVIGAALPVGSLTGVEQIFDGAQAGLAALPVAPGRWALLALAVATLVGVLPRPRRHLGALGVGAGVAVSFVGVLAWVERGWPDVLRGGARLEWVTLEVAVAGTLTLVATSLLSRSKDGRDHVVGMWGAALLAAALGGGAGAWIWRTTAVPDWWWLLWALPAVWGARALDRDPGWRRALRSGLLGLTLAGTATAPAVWEAGVRGEMALAEDRLSDLGSREDPVLVDGLARIAIVADSLDTAGRGGVDVLYQAWWQSGLAGEGRPVRLTEWDPSGYRGVELRVGADGVLPGVLPTLLAEQREAQEPRLLRLDRDDARYVLTVPLDDGGVVSAVAPPFAQGTRPSRLDPFVGPSPVGSNETMTFIPLLRGEDPGLQDPAWVRDGTEWRAEVGVRFANDRSYRVHYAMPLPDPLQALARGTLLLVLNGLLLGAFWLVGHGLRGAQEGSFPPVRGLTISFRGRVTWALFGFFALANGLFGTVAYRTLTQAAHRSAEVISERVVDDAAVWYRTLAGGMDRLARQVESDLVVYQDGELSEGSVEELVELGLYAAWTPYAVQQELAGLEGQKRFTSTELGRWAYVTAYRRLPDGDVLAAQVPLQAGTAAIQAADLVELLGFFVVLGAGLSLGLALFAARALTRPIQALQVASERVGSGNLELRLPADRADEFGAVFRAFNRMVERVRQARSALISTSRRTQLIMDEAAVGMLAVDAAGRVTLVNPRARELLGAAVEPGAPIRSEGPLSEDLGRWLDNYLEGGSDRADHELLADDRRIRVRARRLGTPGALRGAVVAMDDVTDELRAERVLAWGEMARQVAHEVKNPLTPIKLSIQHVRRAWEDGREDFEEILLRNADAMLREIDRLATIAQSFSRFGAPADAGVPLGPVSLESVVGDVMALYGGSVAAVHFTHVIPPGLPPVVARTPELKEVLVNLLENARLASRQGDHVELRARQEDEVVILEVVDEGVGIPDDVLPRIFEPQFSTRSTGTGLGLAIVRRLVSSWGGDVEVESRQDEGTTARIRLRVWSE